MDEQRATLRLLLAIGNVLEDDVRHQAGQILFDEQLKLRLITLANRLKDQSDRAAEVAYGEGTTTKDRIAELEQKLAREAEVYARVDKGRSDRIAELEAENARLKKRISFVEGENVIRKEANERLQTLVGRMRARSGHEGLNRARAEEAQKAQDAYNETAPFTQEAWDRAVERNNRAAPTPGFERLSYSEAAQTEDEARPANVQVRVHGVEVCVKDLQEQVAYLTRRVDQLSNRAER